MKRRDFMRSTAAALAAVPGARAASPAAPLPRTPPDYEGPYYPAGPRHRTSDLIVGDPRDEVLALVGQVLEPDGEAVSDARVEIWQADPLGRYRHPRDSSAGERWSGFLYWGEAATDGGGGFAFRTYVPGAYGSRPPHIHYKVWQGTRLRLTSQLYFRDLGGPRGAARSASADELQTIALQAAGGNLRAAVRIVI